MVPAGEDQEEAMFGRIWKERMVGWYHSRLKGHLAERPGGTTAHSMFQRSQTGVDDRLCSD